jgi:hypothetical protein
MKPSLWLPSVELSMQEEHIMKRIRKAKLFIFLRQYRHELLVVNALRSGRIWPANVEHCPQS